jgi:hypothetical protein
VNEPPDAHTTGAVEDWRQNQVDLVANGSIAESTDALLNLTYHEKDQAWLEAFLLECLEPQRDPQLRALAVTCLGHVGRIFGSIRSPHVIPTLTGLLDDQELGGLAEDALGDISHYAG